MSNISTSKNRYILLKVFYYSIQKQVCVNCKICYLFMLIILFIRWSKLWCLEATPVHIWGFWVVGDWTQAFSHRAFTLDYWTISSNHYCFFNTQSVFGLHMYQTLNTMLEAVLQNSVWKSFLAALWGPCSAKIETCATTYKVACASAVWVIPLV